MIETSRRKKMILDTIYKNLGNPDVTGFWQKSVRIDGYELNMFEWGVKEGIITKEILRDKFGPDWPGWKEEFYFKYALDKGILPDFGPGWQYWVQSTFTELFPIIDIGKIYHAIKKGFEPLKHYPIDWDYWYYRTSYDGSLFKLLLHIAIENDVCPPIPADHYRVWNLLDYATGLRTIHIVLLKNRKLIPPDIKADWEPLQYRTLDGIKAIAYLF